MEADTFYCSSTFSSKNNGRYSKKCIKNKYIIMSLYIIIRGYMSNRKECGAENEQ